MARQCRASLGAVGANVLTLLEMPGLEAAVAARGLVLLRDADWQGAQAALMPVAMTPPPEWRGVVIVVASDIAAALDNGAHDAVPESAGPAEIAARLAARLRDRSAPLAFGPLRIDPVTRRVTRDGDAVPLLPREYALLLHLAQAAGRCVSREELLAEIWGLRFDPGTNLVTVHASRLRAKLDRGHSVAMLRTEKGRGYRLACG